ncbi:hypothetical protein [Desulfoscipio geothermicus]|uniref:Uncharacterized protein n=1 Tax=Desulfoscipio geothermicus DSM 3669 TaxID=1121426 RepID=A0A1I6DJL0_9FIRM|nr:hypothetical protein [Desulfoscipio geothermicus]SFR05532.1 hypothetical protein SAMN05660706_11242 [Desulfoscipio geothermicus DSM 3669]
MLIGKLKKIFIKNRDMKCPDRQEGRQIDLAKIKIGDLEMVMCRRVDIETPHEFSVFVPRVEIRQRYYRDNRLQYEKETIYNSLTIVHAPIHPPAESGRPAKAGERVYKLNQKID